MKEIKFSIVNDPKSWDTNNICKDFDCDCLEMNKLEVDACMRHPDGLSGICVIYVKTAMVPAASPANSAMTNYVSGRKE